MPPLFRRWTAGSSSNSVAAEVNSISTRSAMPDNKATRSKSILGRLQRNLSRHRDRTSSTASSRSTAQPTVDILDTVFSEVDRAECRRTSTEECTQRQHDEEQFESDLLLRRPRRALGRSQSEGRKQRQLGVVSSRDLVLGHKVDWTREGKMGGPDRTIDLVGLCWDGREQVCPETSSTATLSSFAAPSPTRVVYASTLSTYSPRPPLLTATSTPLSQSSTPAAQIVRDYFALNPRPVRDGSCSSDDQVDDIGTHEFLEEDESISWKVGDGGRALNTMEDTTPIPRTPATICYSPAASCSSSSSCSLSTSSRAPSLVSASRDLSLSQRSESSGSMKNPSAKGVHSESHGEAEVQEVGKEPQLDDLGMHGTALVDGDERNAWEATNE